MANLHEDVGELRRETADYIIGAGVESLNQMRLITLEADQPTKTGRNDPCLCGSGKKCKKCCLQAQSQ